MPTKEEPAITDVYVTTAEIILAGLLRGDGHPTMFIARQLKKFHDGGHSDGFAKGRKKGYADGLKAGAPNE